MVAIETVDEQILPMIDHDVSQVAEWLEKVQNKELAPYSLEHETLTRDIITLEKLGETREILRKDFNKVCYSEDKDAIIFLYKSFYDYSSSHNAAIMNMIATRVKEFEQDKYVTIGAYDYNLNEGYPQLFEDWSESNLPFVIMCNASGREHEDDPPYIKWGYELRANMIFRWLKEKSTHGFTIPKGMLYE